MKDAIAKKHIIWLGPADETDTPQVWDTTYRLLTASPGIDPAGVLPSARAIIA